MKTIYIVTNSGYRPAVAFEDKGRADAVCEMCGGDVKEVLVIDAAPSAADVLGAVNAALELYGEPDGGDGCDGGEGDGAE